MDQMTYYSMITDKERELLDKFEGFISLFADMLFKKGSSTHDYIRVDHLSDKTKEFHESELDLPYEYEELIYNCKIYIRNLDGNTRGQYNSEANTITIDVNSQNDDSVLLHEMTHLFEHAINELPFACREIVFICLYQKLMKRIPSIDRIIREHGDITNQVDIFRIGGTHSILFILKCLDIDIDMNYPLGTTMGYDNEFSNYKVIPIT